MDDRLQAVGKPGRVRTDLDDQQGHLRQTLPELLRGPARAQAQRCRPADRGAARGARLMLTAQSDAHGAMGPDSRRIRPTTIRPRPSDCAKARRSPSTMTLRRTVTMG